MLGIYCRTSKARKEKYTIEVQKEKGIKFAKSLGLPYKIYVDDGISGTKDESSRDGISEMFEDMRSQVISATYSIEQARIERDTPTWHLFVSLSLNYKIKYFDGGREVDLENATNRMLAELMSVVNSFYAQLTSQKVKEANAKKVKEGKTHGLKPFGYTRDEKNNYVIFEEEAIHVRRMFELSLNGVGAYSIANILNSEGVPTKFKRNFEGIIKRRDPDTRKLKEFKKEDVIWRGNVISDMLRNPIYKGTRIWKMYEVIPEYENGRSKKIKRLIDQIVTTNHVPPIIDEDTWEKVQFNFEKNKKNVGPKDYYHYLLNGIVFCGKCSHEFRGKKRPKGNDFSYKCSNKRYPNALCDNRGINIPKLESFIIRLLLTDKKSFLLFKNLPSKPAETEKIIESLERKNKELESISKKISKLIRWVTEMDEDDELKEITNELSSLRQKKNRITDEIRLLKMRLNDESMGSFDEKLKEAQKNVTKISSKLHLPENFEIIKKLIKSLIESITVEYQNESQTYLIQIKLIGKEEMVYITHYRHSENWIFTDKDGNLEFNEKKKPTWMNGIGLSYRKDGERFYRYGLKIPKADYINFD
jgi:DNA invertase Pin-like site-specific DNA recombinase